MEAFFVHLLKSSFALLLFTISYYLFLKKETFFSSNRVFLLLGLIISVALPFITISKTVLVEPETMVSNDFQMMEASASVSIPSTSFDWTSILLMIYLIGLVYFSLRLVRQFWSIKNIKKNSDIIEDDNFYHVHTKENIAPFSFFRHIFYYPKQFSPTDLNTILTHEKVHANELHSIDILITELFFILFWFNPAIWVYKIIVKQNLEFLADSKTCATQQDKKQYQYLMLTQVIGKHSIPIVNPFFNSIIKKRIVMLNQNQSKRTSYLKLFLVLPALGFFLVAFNTKKVVKFTEKAKITSIPDEQQPDFISPITPDAIKKITSGFGMAKDPYSNQMKFHNGIDLMATRGTKVNASAEGLVAVSSYDDLKGNYIVINHNDIFSSKYFHLKDKNVTAGERVKSGELIGHVGSTGKSTGPHLHFEIIKEGKSVNPASLVPFKGKTSIASVKKTNAKDTKQASSADKTIDLVISKDTSDEDLTKMKSDLANEKIDFSYTLERNNSGEITSFSLTIKGPDNSASLNSNSTANTTIKPMYVMVNLDTNEIAVGHGKKYKFKSHMNTTHVYTTDAHSKKIEVKVVNGKKHIMVDGEEVSEEELEDNNIHISSYTDSDQKRKVGIKKKKNDFFYFNTDDKEPLFVIDGKVSSKKQFEKLDSDEIESISVLKSKKAAQKYGKKGKDGIIEIKTKKEK
ncbi:MAG: peptidoglycan DD-metalloendopeptidase family protein [Flavobacteriaceae bacterium]|uniref:peptidoglycan DD-metalloendopeptidase family protein n=1 Tax=Maribacter dokdonensis TaxID=320912 RepID=UPI003287C184